MPPAGAYLISGDNRAGNKRFLFLCKDPLLIADVDNFGITIMTITILIRSYSSLPLRIPKMRQKQAPQSNHTAVEWCSD